MEEGRGDGEFFDFLASVENEPLEFGHGHVFGLASVHFLLVTLEAVDGGLEAILVGAEETRLDGLEVQQTEVGDLVFKFGLPAKSGGAADTEGLDDVLDGRVEGF